MKIGEAVFLHLQTEMDNQSKRILTFFPAFASVAGAIFSAYNASRIAGVSSSQSERHSSASGMAGLSLRYNTREMGQAMMLLDAYRKSVALQTSTTGIQLLEAIAERHRAIKCESEQFLLNPTKNEHLKGSFEIEIARRTFTQHFQSVKDLLEDKSFNAEFKAAVGPLCGKVALLFLAAAPMRGGFSHSETQKYENEFRLLEFYCDRCTKLIQPKVWDASVKELAEERLAQIKDAREFSCNKKRSN